MTMVYVDQAGHLVPLCGYCNYWRADHGAYCEACHAWLNDTPPHGIERPRRISRGGL